MCGVFVLLVSWTVENAINTILCNVGYDFGSNSSEDYLLKVHGLSEYFDKYDSIKS